MDKPNSLEDMRVFEQFSTPIINPNSYFVVRVDGRSFHTEVKKLGMDRPFDRELREAMIVAAKEVMSDFRPVFAYTESDECSFLFDKTWDKFDRRAEKIATLISSKMSVAFFRFFWTRYGKLSTLPTFDARVIPLPSLHEVVRYYRWRQMDSHRNAISTYCFWKLVQSGVKERQAAALLDGKKDSFKNELLFSKFNINYNKVSNWEKKGTMIYWANEPKKGYNPITIQKLAPLEVSQPMKMLKYISQLIMSMSG